MDNERWKDWPEVPPVEALPARPRRIILHWTAGTHHASVYEREHYHYLIEGDGTVVEGVPVAANLRTLQPGDTYAAHTRALNSYSVGVAFCGMHGAQPGGPYGVFPLLEAQVREGCIFVGYLCHLWDLPVTPETVFTHAEAERLHGVKQVGKWDIDVLPFALDLSPQAVGDWLRERIHDAATVEV